ncbi:MAG: histidine kinase [Cytophagales bacterium]|nr:histidine kinase [Cytophagales bacterium]
MQISSYIKNFYAWNFLGLLSMCMLLRLYNTEVSWLQWPIAACLSLLVLSSLAFHLRDRILLGLKVFIAAVIFSVAHWILTGCFEVLLTRFFRLPESYSLKAFHLYLSDHYSLVLDGFIWFSVYLILFAWIRSQLKGENLAEARQEMEKELEKVDLKALNQEMSPHFLFNAMNGISMKIRMEKNSEAVNMIAALTDLLRLNLSKKEDLQITIEEELELLNKYLLIEKSRFGEHFNLSMDFPEELMRVKVPRLILQPLVENAFKHGMHHQFEEMELRIEGKTNDHYLVLSVYNSQLDHSNINYVNSNVGLPNIVHRLRRFYGTDFQFQSLNGQSGVVFKISIPLKS